MTLKNGLRPSGECEIQQWCHWVPGQKKACCHGWWRYCPQSLALAPCHDFAAQSADGHIERAGFQRGILLQPRGYFCAAQRQRVAMGRALVRDPQLFLFDEPLSSLDATLRVEMRTEIKRLHSNLNASIVYVTHDQIEAMTLATRIVVMKDGVVQQIGTPSEIYNHPANMFVADFMGASSMNLIPARVKAKPDGLEIRIQQESGVLELLDDARIKGLDSGESRDLLIGLRPENITNPAPDSRLVAPCRIEVVDTVVSPGANIDLAFDLASASYFDATNGERLN